MTRPLTKSWIDKKLSRKEREQLIDYISERTCAPTGEQILDAIGELFPDKAPPSLRAVNEWKAKNWSFELYLRGLAEDNEIAKIISESSADIADANQRLTDGYVFQQLRGLSEGHAPDPMIHDWILAASRLAKRRVEDRRTAAQLKKAEAQIEILSAKIADYNRAEEERKAAKNKLAAALKISGLDSQTLAEIDAKINLL